MLRYRDAPSFYVGSVRWDSIIDAYLLFVVEEVWEECAEKVELAL